jgi:hypothetical protein
MQNQDQDRDRQPRAAPSEQRRGQERTLERAATQESWVRRLLRVAWQSKGKPKLGSRPHHDREQQREVE